MSKRKSNPIIEMFRKKQMRPMHGVLKSIKAEIKSIKKNFF